MELLLQQIFSGIAVGGIYSMLALALVVTLAVTISLALFFQFTKLGPAMRASAKDPQLSRLAGIQVGKMLALAWGLSAGIAAIAGMLIAPIIFLDPNMMGGILLYANSCSSRWSRQLGWRCTRWFFHWCC